MSISEGFVTRELDLKIDENLKKIGLKDSLKTLFCMDINYNNNLFVTLSARNIDKNLSIISLVSSYHEESKMRLAGASYVVNPYDLGSHRIFRLINKPRVFDLLDSMIFENIEYKIDEIKVPKSSSLIGIEFQKLSIEKDYDLLLIGVESSNKFHYNTHKVYRKIKEGDIFVVAGKIEHIKKFQEGIIK